MEIRPRGQESQPVFITYEIQRMDVYPALAVLSQISPEGFGRLIDFDPEGDSDTVTVELPQDKLTAFITQLANERRKPQYRPR